MSGACGTYCRKEKYIQDFSVGKPDGMRPLGKPKCTWKGSMKMGPKRNRTGKCGLDSISGQVQVRHNVP
jgi:hypothetical protein